METKNVADEKRNEAIKIFEKLDNNAQNILIAAGSCMLARQQMDQQKKAG